MKLVFFDLDGTLLNTLDDLADAANLAMARLGFPEHPVEKYRYMVGNGVPKLIERCLPEGERTEENFSGALDIFNEYYHAHCTDKTRPYEGILPLADRLRAAGVKCAVASNKPDDFVQALVKNFFGDRFDMVRGSLPGVPKKPEPDIALDIMRTLGAEPGGTYFTGDSNVDILTAKNARVTAIGCLWGFRDREELVAAGADFLAEKPGDIFDIVEGQRDY